MSRSRSGSSHALVWPARPRAKETASMSKHSKGSYSTHLASCTASPEQELPNPIDADDRTSFPEHEDPPAKIETVTDLLDAARLHGLRLTTESADFDRSGLDFLVLHARDDNGVPWIVRTPRRPEVLASTRVEARVLRLIRSRLPVAVPDWRVHSRGVIAYPRLAGTPAVTIAP